MSRGLSPYICTTTLNEAWMGAEQSTLIWLGNLAIHPFEGAHVNVQLLAQELFIAELL